MTVRAFSYADLLSISDHYEAAALDWTPREGEVAVDAGAFIGRHTLSYARACGPSGRVLAIESDKTIILDQDDTVTLADKLGITIVALNAEELVLRAAS